MKDFLVRHSCLNKNPENKLFASSAKTCFGWFESYIKSIDLFTSNIVGEDEREKFIELVDLADEALDSRGNDQFTNMFAKSLIQFLRDKQIYVDAIVTDSFLSQEDRERFCFSDIITMYKDTGITYRMLQDLFYDEKEHLIQLHSVYMIAERKDKEKKKLAIEDYLIELKLLEVGVELSRDTINNICNLFSYRWVNYSPNEDRLVNYNTLLSDITLCLESNKIVNGFTFAQRLLNVQEESKNQGDFGIKLFEYEVAELLYDFNLLNEKEFEIIQYNFTHK